MFYTLMYIHPNKKRREKSMICRECGARIDDDAVECKFCGAQYGSAEVVEEPVEPAEAVAAEEIPAPAAVPEETYGAEPDKDAIDEILDENEIKRRNQMEKIRAEKQTQLEEIEHRRKIRKRKQRRNVLLVILLVVLIGAAVAAGVYYLSPAYTGNNEDDVVIVTQPPTTKPEKTEEPEETALPEPTITTEPTAEPTEEPEDEIITATESPAVSYATPKPAAVKPVTTKKPAAVQTGITKTLKNATITGGEVIKANGKSYMSFIYNNKWYYAKVSDNTTTKFIAWKKMTVNAYTKGETYKGVPVFTITKITHQDASQPTASQQGTVQSNGSYILPNSATQLITTADLQGMTVEKLRLARNEIYARHGRTFKDASLQNYFNSCSWYKPNSGYNYANENANLNAVEKQNIITIRNYENSIK